MSSEAVRFSRILAGASSVFVIASAIGWRASSPAVDLGPRQILNLSYGGDPDHTVAVARDLWAELRTNNWNWRAADLSLMSVPDQANYQFAPEGRGYWTWDQCPQEEYADEVAFYTRLYTWSEMVPSDGPEGKTARVTGFYIVAWKDGNVERVPVADARMYPCRTGGSITVFPGMSEYDPALPTWGDPEYAEKMARFRSHRKT